MNKMCMFVKEINIRSKCSFLTWDIHGIQEESINKIHRCMVNQIFLSVFFSVYVHL